VSEQKSRLSALAALTVGAADLVFGLMLRFFPSSSDAFEPRLGARWLALGLMTIVGAIVAAYFARPKKGALLLLGFLPLVGLLALLMPVLSILEPIVRDQFLPAGLEAAGGLALIAGAIELAYAHAARELTVIPIDPQSRVHVLKGDPKKKTEVAIDSLIPGDEIELDPGDDVPVDGTVVSGSGFVDETALIGPSLPSAKRSGDPLFAGSRSSIPNLVMRVGAPYADCVLVQREQLASGVVEDLARVGSAGKAAAIAALVVGAGAIAMVIGHARLERIEDWIPEAAGAALACVAAAPALALMRGLLRTLVAAREAGLIVARTKDVLTLSSAKRWQVDPRLIATPGEVEVLALGDEPSDRLLQVAEALVGGELSPELATLTAALRKKKLGSASGAALRRAQSVYHGTVDGVRWYMGPQRAVEEEEQVELERSLESSIQFLRDKGFITWLVGKPSEGIVGALGIGVGADSQAKKAAMKLHATVMPGLPDATRNAVAAAAAIACDGPPLSKHDGTLLAESSPSPSTGLRVRVLRMRPGIELRSDQSPRIPALCLEGFADMVRSSRSIAWRARGRAVALAIIPPLASVVLAWLGLLGPIGGAAIGVGAVLATGRVRSSNRAAKDKKASVDHEAVTLISTQEAK
jgi:cation transport ATPase